MILSLGKFPFLLPKRVWNVFSAPQTSVWARNSRTPGEKSVNLLRFLFLLRLFFLLCFPPKWLREGVPLDVLAPIQADGRYRVNFDQLASEVYIRVKHMCLPKGHAK